LLAKREITTSHKGEQIWRWRARAGRTATEREAGGQMAGPNAFVLQGSRSVASSRLRLAQIDFPYAPLVPTSYDASSSRRRYLAESGTRALPSTISCLSTLAARERRHLRDWRQRRFETYI